MDMSKEEIVRHYRQAKNKKADIKVLADLNATTPEAICEILLESGAMRRKYERKDQPKPTAKKEAAPSPGQPRAAERPDIYERLETILGSVPDGAAENVSECAFELCSALYLDYLRKRLHKE